MAYACLSERDVAAMAECIRLDHDCAELCRLAVGLMSRGSRFSVEACRLCAEICDACAQECERHDFDHCRACAQACRKCADECRRMATATPEARSPPVGAHA